MTIENINNILNVTYGKVPVSHHPKFGETYDNYADKYNALSEQLEGANIDIKFLIDVVQATKDFEQLGYIECYKMGYSDGIN